MNMFKKARAEGEWSEHRKVSRFTIPGATISFEKSTAGYCGSDSLFERSPVVEISRKGVSFLTNNPPRLSGISLILTYAEDASPLRLEGRVVYFVSRGAGLSPRFRVGVEFAPFSTGHGHNSLDTLIQLQRLEKIYGEKSSDIAY